MSLTVDETTVVGHVTNFERDAALDLKAADRNTLEPSVLSTVEEFDRQNPFAPDEKRLAYLVGRATTLDEQRRTNIANTYRMIPGIATKLEAAIADREEFPSEPADSQPRCRRAGGDRHEFAGADLGPPGTERPRGTDSGKTFPDAEKMYEAAIRTGDTFMVRTIEREAREGWPSLTRRAEDIEAQRRLTETVTATRSGRVPQELKDAHARLTATKTKLGTWHQVFQSLPAFRVSDFERIVAESKRAPKPEKSAAIAAQ